MRHATTAKVRLDAGEAERFSASAQSSDCFDRLLPARALLSISKTMEGVICARQPSGIWGMSE
jgi:hypothetical protein